MVFNTIMDFKFQERKCDVEHDKRIASFRNRGFCDVAKDILARQKELSDALLVTNCTIM